VTRIAVVGAGLSGTAMALHALAQGAESVTLIEREYAPGRGVAYGTRRPEHLLNVPARRMSVFPADPEHFARWVGDGEDFAQRRLFGDYLSDMLAASGAELVRGEAVAVEREGGEERVRLADGGAVAADAVVLALGNLKPAPPPGLRPEALGGLYVEDPWFGGIAEGLAESDTVLLVGTGLTAVDAALTLDAEGFEGRIVALSRRGLAPRANLRREAVAAPPAGFPASCSGLLRAVRRRAAAIGWREAVHEVRQRVQALWARAPLDARRRFIRHLRPWWDVHRHRIAPAVAERIQALESRDLLRFVAGRLISAERSGRRAAVRWRRRGGEAIKTLEVDRIINCTGPELDIRRAGEPLLDSLVAAGRIRPDACRLGIDVDSECRTLDRDGTPSGTLAAIGPMTRGAFWESIAVSDIAAQAQAVAARLAPGTGFRSGS
jgi:uncharacterized NAD(P)/FAD-binding protein YdhS